MSESSVKRGRAAAGRLLRRIARSRLASQLHPYRLRSIGLGLSRRLHGTGQGAGPQSAAPDAGPRRKTLILHVGMGKTGTTAIQNALWDNRAVLARHGVTYPTVGAVEKAHHLISPRCPPFLKHTGWRFLAVEEWAPLLAGGATTEVIVMSSELIAWCDPREVEAFCAALAPLFDLRICFYLRRQDNGMMAGYNQQIKAGTQTGSIDQMIEKQLDRFDYLQKIWPWEKAVGAGKLIVLPYERGQFHKRDLVDDFLWKVLGMERPEGFAVEANRNPNPRFSRGGMEYKRRINILMRDPAASERFNPIIARYSVGTDANSGAIFHEHELLTYEQRTQIMRAFKAGNAYVARKFLGRDDGLLFLDTEIPRDRERRAEEIEPEFRALSAVIEQEQPALFAELRSVVEGAMVSEGGAARRAAADLWVSFGEGEANFPAPRTRRRGGTGRER